MKTLSYCQFYINAYPFFNLETQSPDSLRKKLKLAVTGQDKQGLEDAIGECEVAGYPELGSELRRARSILEHLGGGVGG